MGGAAPMNSSAEVADVVARLCFGFSQKLAELCVRYVRVMPEVTIDGSALGWSWEVTYDAATEEDWWLLERSIRNPARASRSFQLRHPAFIIWNDVRNSGDEALVFVDGTPWMVWLCGPWLVAERRRAPRTPSCHFSVCLQCHAGRHSALQWGVTRAPHLRQSVFTPRCGSVSGAEMIGQEHIRNVPVFGEVLSGCRCLATRLERVLGRQARHGDLCLQLEHTNVYYNATCVRSSHSLCCSHGLGTRYQRHRLRLDFVGFQAEGSDRRQSFSCATLPAA